MDLDLVFLGTSASAPTASRGASATLLRRGGDRLLIDCGEGTQRQLLRSDAGLVDLEHVFLTHLHADHVLGLPGMLKTFALRGREVPITVYGPGGTRALLRALGVVIGRLTYPFEVVELGSADVVTRDGYRVEAFGVAHGRGALGYALREDGRPGRFDVSAADALGVPDGPSRGALQRGEPVTLADGRVVRPEDVLGPPRRGRTIVLSGDMHAFFVNDVNRTADDATSPIVATELVTTSITSPARPQNEVDIWRPENPNVRLLRSDVRGFLKLTIERARSHAELVAVDDVTRADSTTRVIAAFDVADGEPGVAR